MCMYLRNYLIYLFLLFLLPLTAQQAYKQTYIREGIKVDFEMIHLDESKNPRDFRIGDDIRFRFSISDTLTEQPLSSAYPAAWVSLKAPIESATCQAKVATFVAGNVLTRAELDLNSYYVLTLNDDPSIHVVDPLFGFGGSKLLMLINLNSPGEDWVVKTDQKTVFVSTPKAEEVAVINTNNWAVEKNISIGAQPYDIQLQEDEQYLWVAYTDSDDRNNSGVAIINANTFELIKKIQTGAGQHELSISDDNLHVYVTNEDAGTVSVIDIRQLKKIKDISTGIDPLSISFSTIANAAYISHASEGKVVAIDNKSLNIRANIPTGVTGIGQIRFAPNGKLAFITNTKENTVHILDAALDKIIQVADVEEGPNQITFSDELAYVRHQGSEIVWMIPIAALGTEGAPVQVIDFPGGQYPPGKMDDPILADGIIQTVGASAMLVANPMDETVYFYMEGMAAPMGSFNNYGKKPKAANVVDRSLRELEPGVYETTAKLEDAGIFDVAFFMDVPRMVHCFQIEIRSDENIELARLKKKIGSLLVEYLGESTSFSMSEKAQLKFRLKDIETKEIASGLSDVQVMSMSVSGVWNRYDLAVETEEPGVYSLNLNLPQQGIYYCYIQSQSKGFFFNNPQYFVIEMVQ